MAWKSWEIGLQNTGLSIAKASDTQSSMKSTESESVRESAEDPGLLLNQDRLIGLEDPAIGSRLSTLA